jgi:DNA-binding GntR family transcriptional regulator
VTLKEIGAIVEAIGRRDAKAARRLAEAHVKTAAAVADRRFEELEQSQKDHRR